MNKEAALEKYTAAHNALQEFITAHPELSRLEAAKTDARATLEDTIYGDGATIQTVANDQFTVSFDPNQRPRVQIKPNI